MSYLTPNSSPLAAGWFKRSWLASLAVSLLVSSASADDILTNLGNQATKDATTYGTAAGTLLAAFAVLILTVFIAAALLALLNNRSSD